MLGARAGHLAVKLVCAIPASSHNSIASMITTPHPGMQITSVAIVDDTRREGAEFFNVMLSSPIGATLTKNKTAVVTILASDVSIVHDCWAQWWCCC